MTGLPRQVALVVILGFEFHLAASQMCMAFATVPLVTKAVKSLDPPWANSITGGEIRGALMCQLHCKRPLSRDCIVGRRGRGPGPRPGAGSSPGEHPMTISSST